MTYIGAVTIGTAPHRAKFVNIQHPVELCEIESEMLAFQTDFAQFYGADKARSASDRPH